MDEKKQIQVNTEFLNINHRSKKPRMNKKKSEKKAQLMNVNNASVKELLLQKLKEYRKKKKEKIAVPNPSVVTDDFMEKVRRRKNRTENVDVNPFEVIQPQPQAQAQPQAQPQVQPQVQPQRKYQIIQQPELPKYSNLKHSTVLPTYREYIRKTQKKDTSRPRVHLKSKHFKVGKNKTAKTVGIFLKNTTLKNNVDEDIVKWKSSNLKTVKNYLKKRNLVHYGTNAPNELLREMYVSSNLCGNLENVNGKKLLDNYLETN